MFVSDGTQPTVKVLVVQETLTDSAELTLACVVSSPVLQDYYIAWTENNGARSSSYVDGDNFPPQKSQHGYTAVSVYTTNAANWNNNKMHFCNVWPAGSSKAMEPQGVSKRTSGCQT